MSFSPSLPLAAILAAWTTAAAYAQNPIAPETDRAALLQGVTAISAPGVPGGVSAFGPQAFAVVAGKDGKTASLPVVAATRWEKGRIVAFGHNGYLNETKDAGSGALLLNSARWSAGDKPKAKVAVIKNVGLAAFLKSGGLEAEAIEDKDWTKRLTEFDAVCIDAHKLVAGDVEPLIQFVRRGGGLVTASTGWGWLTGKEKIQLATEFPGNLVLEPAGLVFTAGMPGKTTKSGYTVGGDLALLSAHAALDAVISQTAGKSTLSLAQLTQCSATIADALRALPPGDTVLRPRLAALNTSTALNDFPRPDKPLPAENALARLVVTQQLEALRQLKPEQLKTHPAAEAFPGAVSATAPRIPNRAIPIDTGVPAWHSTGLYAAPGELIRVSVPPELVDKGYSIRIGCHTDSLWHLEKWQRAPEISRREPIKTPLTTAANPFGGLIYIDVPEKAAPNQVTVSISGGVESPRFVLGQTSLAEWKTKVRTAPAPWAELETKKLILSVPSEKIRQLDDPEALMKFWDLVLDADADLIGLPHERKRPERIVPDTQISAGYMHSGYPIMTPLDKSVEQTLSLAELKAGTWGHFHELGHNHQQPEWTFDGTTEVTCNLFSLYCMETLCGKPPGQGHDAMKPETVDKRLRGYLGMGDKFTRWKSDPFLALTMYHQLRTAFGWETYKKVFAEYRDLPKDQRPKNDDEERDQWMVRFSRATGKNLGPFFEAWGVPTSPTARDSIKELAAWMPTDWPR